MVNDKMALEATGNLILDSLPATEYARLAPHLVPVKLELGEVIFRPDETLRYLYFPQNSIISLLTGLTDGSGVEVGLVGHEGMSGLSVLLGGKENKTATIQQGGQALKIPAEVMQEEFKRGGVLQARILHYTHALITQISQAVACNVRHTIEQRMIRWLLMYHDRLREDEFSMTHEFMALMLGVRRASVTVAASNLLQTGTIEYRRGHVRILDRKLMETLACECYAVVGAEYKRLSLLSVRPAAVRPPNGAPRPFKPDLNRH
jgi:CRP-like cAMP-binding protein